MSWQKIIIIIQHEFQQLDDNMLNNLHLKMADITVEEQRTVISFYIKLGKSLRETNEDLQTIYGYFTLTNQCASK